MHENSEQDWPHLQHPKRSSQRTPCEVSASSTLGQSKEAGECNSGNSAAHSMGGVLPVAVLASVGAISALCVGGCHVPMTDRAWAISNLSLCTPSTKSPQIVNLQWSVCLHVAQSGNTFRGSFCSIREYIQRFSPARRGTCGVCVGGGHTPPFASVGGVPGNHLCLRIRES